MKRKKRKPSLYLIYYHIFSFFSSYFFLFSAHFIKCFQKKFPFCVVFSGSNRTFTAEPCPTYNPKARHHAVLLGSFGFPKNSGYGNPCKQVSSLISYHGRIDKTQPLVEFADSVGGGIFRRSSSNSLKHEKCLHRSINAYFVSGLILAVPDRLLSFFSPISLLMHDTIP